MIFLLALLVVGSEALQEPQTCLQNGDPQMAKLLEQMLFEAKFKSERYLADRNRSEEQLQQTGLISHSVPL